MSDLGCWRNKGCPYQCEYVIRVNGVEVSLSHDDLEELISRASNVLDGDDESLSRGFQEIHNDHAARLSSSAEEIIKMIGIEAKPLVRRI